MSTTERDLTRLHVSRGALRGFSTALWDYLLEDPWGDMLARASEARAEVLEMIDGKLSMPYLAADTLEFCCDTTNHVLEMPGKYPLSDRRRESLERALAGGRESLARYRQAEEAFREQSEIGCLQMGGLVIGICLVGVVLGCVFSLF